MIHWLKTRLTYFDEIWHGDKPYEIRSNDRNFCVDDILIIAEGIVEAQAPRAVIARVTHLLEGFPGITDGYVGLGLHILGRIENDDPALFEYHKSTVTSKAWTSTKRRDGEQIPF